MNWSYYESHLQKTVKGKKKRDLTALVYKPEVYRNLINDLSKPFLKAKFDRIASISASGFLLVGGVALKLKKGIVPIRKGGDSPVKKSDLFRVSFVDYSGKKKSLELNKRAVSKGEKVLLIDDWIETGAQVRAAIELIERSGCKIIGISCIGFQKNKKTESLLKYKIFSIVKIFK